MKYLKLYSGLISIYFLFLLILLSQPVYAHHSGANFDRETTVELAGSIVGYTFRNPHIYVEIKVQNDDGESSVWLIEGHSVTGARRLGWSSTSLHIGENVTITANPDIDTSKQFGFLNSIEKEDGSFLYAFRKAVDDDAEKIVITPSYDFSGTWELDLKMFDFSGVNAQPPSDYSYTETGLLQREFFSTNDNPAINCQTVGVPRMIVWPYGYNFSRNDEVIVITKEHEDIRREIFLNRELNDILKERPERTHIGVSVGYFTTPKHLVVETGGFSATPWGLSSGLDSSEKKRVVEQYQLDDSGFVIDVTYTVEDPEYLTAPITVKGRYLKTPNRDFNHIPCDPVTAGRHLEK
jgi:hypothetical protein